MSNAIRLHKLEDTDILTDDCLIYFNKKHYNNPTSLYILFVNKNVDISKVNKKFKLKNIKDIANFDLDNMDIFHGNMCIKNYVEYRKVYNYFWFDKLKSFIYTFEENITIYDLPVNSHIECIKSVITFKGKNTLYIEETNGFSLNLHSHKGVNRNTKICYVRRIGVSRPRPNYSKYRLIEVDGFGMIIRG